MTISPLKIAVIGQGKLGGTLSRALSELGHYVVPVRRGSIADCAVCDVMLIATQDDKIALAADEIAAQGWNLRGKIIAHHSGSVSSNILSRLQEKGAHIASIHPLQTFPNLESGLRALPGTFWFCEGDDAAIGLLGELIAQLHGTAVPIGAEQKAGYHAAVCMAANYLTVLVAAATDVANQSGIDADLFRAAIAPIMRATLDNTLELPPQLALTGPARRGDMATIAAHREAIQNLPINSNDLSDVYQVLYDYARKHIA